MKKYTFGRDVDCDYIILDPQRRVSRKHGTVYELKGEFYLKDTGSANGIYINGNRIEQNTDIKFKLTDVITLSKDYVLDVFEVMPIMPDPVDGYTNFHKQYVVPFMQSTDSIRISKDEDNLSVEIHIIPSNEQITAIARSLNKGDNFFYEIPLFGKNGGGAIYDTNPSYVRKWLTDIRQVMIGYK